MPHKDPQVKRDYNRHWSLTHRKERNASQRTYNSTHREEERAYSARYRATHHEGVAAYQAAYRLAHREEHKAYKRAYDKAHPGIGQSRWNRRRARKKALPATFTIAQWQAIKAAYKQRCAYCGAKPKTLTQDHVIPLSKNGGTVPGNIVPACKSCNSAKQDREAPAIPAIRLLL